jgi:hypothetical protein
LCSIAPHPPEYRTVRGIMWKNIVEPGRSQMTIWCTRIARWVPKATDTHSEYEILIAFPLHEWLHERPSVLRYSTLPVFCHVNILTGA